jgi:hypothetical protein
MARDRPPERDSPGDPPRDAEVTVQWDADPARHSRRGTAVVAVAVILGVAAVLYGGVLQRYRRAPPPPAAFIRSPTIGPDVLIGPDALAAAFREALRCHTLTYAASDPEYFRAQPARTGACRQYGAASAVIYRQVNREFRLVLDTADYVCPVRGLPPEVQVELGLCPKSGSAQIGSSTDSPT